MTDGPQQCALPGCDEMVEQPEDGGPRRLYCSPAHRAAARKMRHAARMDSAAPQQAASDVTQPIAQAPRDQQSEQPTTELPAPLGVSAQEEPEPTRVPDREWSPAAAWTVTPPTLPAASTERTIRTITSQRVKKQKPARTAADLKNAATHLRRRAIASVAIASLVAGGASYFVSENVIPTTPTPLPPQAANPPSMDADVWADKAQVVLASLSTQLDAVAQAEADWLALPAQRRAQEPAAVQALKERKALLEQQRAILMSQLDAFKTLPERTSELTSAQAQLDAVERTLNESTTTAASPDYKEALRQLESQREIRRQQRDHAAKALTDLRNGVEQALSSPLPAEKDETSPIVERVKAVVEGRPDPGEKDKDEKHDAADEQEPAANPRREDGDEERGDVGTTAPPDPERPNAPDILADGGRNSDSASDGGSDGGSKGDDKSDGPVQSIAGTLGSALGQGDSSNKDERENRRESRGDDGKADEKADDKADGDDRDSSRGGLGGVVRDVGGALLGGSDRDDDRGDDGKDRHERSSDRDDDRDSKNDRSSSWSDRDDDDDRGSRRDRDDDDDDRGGLVRGISDGLLGGDDRDDDSDRKKPSGKAERERNRDKDREDREDRHEKDSSDKDDSDDERADGDNDRKKPSGKAERERNRDKDREDREDGEHRDKDDDKTDRDDDGDRKGSDKKDKDSDKDDDGDSDKGKDRGDSDDDGGDDGGKSDKKDKGDDDGGDSGDSDSGGDDD